MIFAYMLLAAVATAVPVVVVVAQGEAVPVIPETTFGWVILSWLIYAVAGLIASITQTPAESFDAIKFTRSFLIMLLTGLAALAFKISPASVETQFGGVLTTVANIIVNTAPGVTLIYLFEKLYKLATNLAAKIQSARSLTYAGPQKP